MDVDRLRRGMAALGYDVTALRWDEMLRVYQRAHGECSKAVAEAAVYAAADAPPVVAMEPDHTMSVTSSEPIELAPTPGGVVEMRPARKGAKGRR